MKYLNILKIELPFDLDVHIYIYIYTFIYKCIYLSIYHLYIHPSFYLSEETENRIPWNEPLLMFFRYYSKDPKCSNKINQVIDKQFVICMHIGVCVLY